MPPLTIEHNRSAQLLQIQNQSADMTRTMEFLNYKLISKLDEPLECPYIIEEKTLVPLSTKIAKSIQENNKVLLLEINSECNKK